MSAADPPIRFAAVYFDCDSTLVSIEGIDELARNAPDEVRRAVEDATRRAMDGEVPLDAVYGERLAALRPDRDTLAALGRRYVETLVPGARATLEALRAADVEVGIVSGGLLPAVAVLAADLCVPPDRVHAVDCAFDADGRFVRHVDGPLARAGGKIEVLRAVRQAAAGPVAFVGDGATDVEAAGEVDLFVGFGGVARRDAVVRACGPHFVDGPDLSGVLDLLQ